MESKHSTTIVITVSSIQARKGIMKKIYTNLTKEPSVQFTVIQDQINRIKIFHNGEKGVKVLIRTYIIFVIPILINLKALNDVYGYVDFRLGDTIKHLRAHITKLESLQGQKFVKSNQGNNLEATLTNMLGDFNGKTRF